MKILITGAAGFIGTALSHYLSRRGQQELILSSRKDFTCGISDACKIITGNIDANTDWSNAVTNTDVVIHTAGIAHKKNITADQYSLTHVIATQNLAKQCIQAGVKQFIYLSSIGVHGSTSVNSSFSENSSYQPINAYALSKQRTEEILKDLCSNSPMALTVVRPPLVYDAQAPGNFQRLLYATYRGVPMPVAGINNQRSIIALENLLNFITHCVNNPNAMNQDFVISDTEKPLSTQNIIEYIAIGMNRQARLFGLPRTMLELLAKLTGQKEKYIQLCGNLVINTSKAQQILEWVAPFSTKEMLIKAGNHYSVERQKLEKKNST